MRTLLSLENAVMNLLVGLVYLGQCYELGWVLNNLDSEESLRG
jgi:hypothetical protein